MPKPLNLDWPAVRVLAVAVGVREAARQMGISQDAVRQRSKREGWMTSPQTLTQRALAKPVTKVSPNAVSPAVALANVLSERKERSRLGLSKYVAEAAEQAGDHPDKLGIASKVRDVSHVHGTIWPEQPNSNNTILNIDILTGKIAACYDIKTGLDDTGRTFEENVALGRDNLERWGGTPPCSHLLKAAKATEVHPNNGAQPNESTSEASCVVECDNQPKTAPAKSVIDLCNERERALWRAAQPDE